MRNCRLLISRCVLETERNKEQYKKLEGAACVMKMTVTCIAEM